MRSALERDPHAFELHLGKSEERGSRAIARSESQHPIGLAVADVVVTVPATTGDKLIGPFPYEHFADATGQCALTYSAATNVTIAVLDLSS